LFLKFEQFIDFFFIDFSTHPPCETAPKARRDTPLLAPKGEGSTEGGRKHRRGKEAPKGEGSTEGGRKHRRGKEAPLEEKLGVIIRKGSPEDKPPRITPAQREKRN
jgi:hypothetical protein